MSVKRLSTFLESVLVDTLGLQAAATQVRLLRAWGEIVGPLLSGKTAPGKIRNGVLTIFVPNHAWAQELQLSTPVLLGRIRTVAGGEKIRDIRFSVDSGNFPPAGEKSGRGEGEVPAPGAIAPGDDIPVPEPDGIEEVRDPETREILRSLYRRSSRNKE